MPKACMSALKDRTSASDLVYSGSWAWKARLGQATARTIAPATVNGIANCLRKRTACLPRAARQIPSVPAAAAQNTASAKPYQPQVA